jgi:hypothetical protein
VTRASIGGADSLRKGEGHEPMVFGLKVLASEVFAFDPLR